MERLGSAATQTMWTCNSTPIARPRHTCKYAPNKKPRSVSSDEDTTRPDNEDASSRRKKAKAQEFEGDEVLDVACAAVRDRHLA